MREVNLADTLLKGLYLLVFLIILGQVKNMDTLSSVSFMLTFFGVFFIWLLKAKENLNQYDIQAFFICGSAFLCVMACGVLESGTFDFTYFKKFIIFCCTILFFAIITKIEPKKDVKKYVLLLNTLLIFLFCYLYWTEKSGMYLMNGIITKYLNFGFANPNLAGMFCCCIGILELIQALEAKSWRQKFVFFLLGGLMVYFMLETKSRNCLLAFLIFIVIAIVITIDRKFKFRRFTAFVITVFPLLFAALYLLVENSPSISAAFEFLASEGKGLDSRITIWQNALQEFKHSPIIGAYSTISEGRGFSQMHNTHIDILVSYGCIVFVAVTRFLYKIIYSIGKALTSYGEKLYFAAFTATYLMGIGEAALFSGGIGIYLCIGVFLILAKNKKVFNRSETDENCISNELL